MLPAVADTPEPAQPAAGEGEVVAAQDTPEPGFLSRWWPALLALLAVLLGLVFFVRRRADDQHDPEEDEQVMPAQPTRVAPEAAAPEAGMPASEDEGTVEPPATDAESDDG